MKARRFAIGMLVIASITWSNDARGDYLYWADQLNGTDAILRANLSQPLPITNYETIVSNVRTRALSIDSQNGKLYYWKDNNVWRADPDGSNAQAVLVNVDARALAVDPYDQKLYWASQSALHRTNLDGTNDTLLSGFTGEPHGLALDLEHQFVYWTESTSGFSGFVARRGFEQCPTCSSREIVFSSSDSPQWGLSLDVPDNFAFFPENNSIVRISLDGADSAIVASSLPQVQGLTVDPFNNYAYWSPLSGNIQRMTYAGGGQQAVVSLTPPNANPDVMAIYFTAVPEPCGALLTFACCFIISILRPRLSRRLFR